MAKDLTWEIVEFLYPEEDPDKLREQLKTYGFDDPAKAGLVYEVITKGSKERWDTPTQKFVQVETPSYWPFTKGGIHLAFGHADREPFGMGRKSSKWFVDSESFGTFAAAMTRAVQVRRAEPEFYESGW